MLSSPEVLCSHTPLVDLHSPNPNVVPGRCDT